MLRYILILLLWTPFVHAAEPDAQAKRHFQDYLAECGTNEIRCLWFHDDSAAVGMVMQLNLADYSVRDYRDVFDHALQGGGDRKMSHPQLLTLRKSSTTCRRQKKRRIIAGVSLSQCDGMGRLRFSSTTDGVCRQSFNAFMTSVEDISGMEKTPNAGL